MTDSPTLWSDQDGLEGIARFTSKNPKFRYLSIVIGSIVIIGMVLLVMFTTPKENKLIAKFESNPEGASVIIDGAERGKTPITLRVKPGASELTLKKPGYAILKTQINVESDGDFFTYDLVLQTQGLTITSNPENARVYFDGHFEGYTPFAFRKDTTGTHRIKVSLQGYAELEKEIDFDLGEGVFFNLEKKTYNVSIDSIPQGAELYLEEKHIGTTPWKGTLPSGEYKIRLAKEGQRMIKREVVITSDVELRYSFQTKDISIESTDGADTITGGLLYVCIVKSAKIDEDIPPLLLGPSPWSGNSELVSSYLTQEGKVPSFGLLVAKHPYYGASLSKAYLDDNGQVREIEKLVLPGISSLDIIGQPIDRIDFATLLTEQPGPVQTIDNKPRFTIIQSNVFVDRDATPIKKTNLRSKPDLVIISPNEKYMAYLYGGKVNLLETATYKEVIKSIPGKSFAFSPSSDRLFVQDQNEMATIQVKTGAIARARCERQGVIVPVNETFVIIAAKSTLALWSSEEERFSSWQDILGDSIWARAFAPSGVIVRNIGGKDRVLILGETFGIPCAVALEPKPTLINLWMPEKTTTVAYPSQ